MAILSREERSIQKECIKDLLNILEITQEELEYLIDELDLFDIIFKIVIKISKKEDILEALKTKE